MSNSDTNDDSSSSEFSENEKISSEDEVEVDNEDNASESSPLRKRKHPNHKKTQVKNYKINESDSDNPKKKKSNKFSRKVVSNKHRDDRVNRKPIVAVQCKDLIKYDQNIYTHNISIPKNTATLAINLRRRNMKTISLLCQFSKNGDPSIIYQDQHSIITSFN